MLKLNPKWWDGTTWQPVIETPSATVVASGTTSTVTTITTIPTSVNGSATFTVGGTVKTSGGSNVTNGTAALKYSTNGGSSWSAAVASQSITAGTFSFTNISETETRLWRVEYTAGAGNSNSTSPTKTVTRKVLTTFTVTKNCSGSESYKGDGTARGTAECYQGYYSSTNGRQKSFLLFPSFATDLADAVSITSIKLKLNALHWGPDSGGTAAVRAHTNTSVPASWSGVNAWDSSDDQTGWTSKTGIKWCDLSNNAITDITDPANWRGGTPIRGFLLVAPSDSLEYYGYFAGNGQTDEPQLEIKYTEWV